jgi:hypothetical protein
VTRYPPSTCRARFQRTLADQRRRDRLGEIAGDQLALLYDKLGDVPLGLVRNLCTLQQRHDHRGVHVEGERRRRTPLAQHFVGYRVIEKAGPRAAPFLADSEREKPFLAQTFVILDRMAGVAVMCCRPLSEIGRQLTTSVLQALLIGGELKIHASALLSRICPLI